VVVANASDLHVRLLGIGKDWLVGMNIAAQSMVEALETNAQFTIVTYPSVNATGNKIDVQPKGDRTACIFVEAPPGTNIVVTGSSDNDVLYTGVIVAGGVVSQGQLLKVQSPGLNSSKLLRLAQLPHEIRLKLVPNPPRR
jgi:hypothetical protein